MSVSKNNLDQAIAAAREALTKYWDGDEMSGIGAAVDDLLAALDAQPIAGEVWQYRANSTSRGKEWIDCRDERAARDMEALGFEIRLLYAAPPAAAAAPTTGAHFAGLDYTGRPIYRHAERTQGVGRE